MMKDSPTAGAERTINALTAISNGLDKFLTLILVIIFASMFGLSVNEILRRSLFNAPFIWGQEMTRFLMIWMAYIGAALAVINDEHLRVDFFINYLPAKIRYYYEYFVDFVVFVYLVIFLHRSYLYTLSQKGIMSSVVPNFPMYLAIMSLPVGTLLLMVFLVIKVVLRIERARIARLNGVEVTADDVGSQTSI